MARPPERAVRRRTGAARRGPVESPGVRFWSWAAWPATRQPCASRHEHAPQQRVPRPCVAEPAASAQFSLWLARPSARPFASSQPTQHTCSKRPQERKRRTTIEITLDWSPPRQRFYHAAADNRCQSHAVTPRTPPEFRTSDPRPRFSKKSERAYSYNLVDRDKRPAFWDGADSASGTTSFIAWRAGRSYFDPLQKTP